MNKAKKIKDLKDWRSYASLYKLDVPIRYWDGTTNYVIVSAVVARGSGPETYIFPSDESGEPYEMLGLEGSYRGGLDHEEALKGAGYEIRNFYEDN